MEKWKPIKNYEGIYEISSLGRVKSLKYNKEKTSKLTVDRYGYYIVGLTKGGVPSIKRVHKLVAVAFLNHKPDGHTLVVNHIDFNKLNNISDNLEIITQRENANHKHIKSSSKYVGVSREKGSLKWRAQIYIDGKNKHIGRFTYELDAAIAYEKELKQIKAC